MNSELPTAMKESFIVSRRVLGNMMEIIDRMIAGAIGHLAAPSGMTEGFAGRPAMRRVFPLMLQALGSSSNTLLHLSDEPGLQSRDCFSVCRSIVELAVNLCYICAEGEAVAERAERHAQQKALRDLNRTSRIGDQEIRLYFQAMETIEVPEELRESMVEFTSRSGREKGWTDLSIDSRCERVGQVLGPKIVAPLHWARFAVYRHSSEILHGTFFGVCFFTGFTDPAGPPASVNQWLEKIAGQHLMVLMAAILSIVAVTKAMAIIANTPMLAADAERNLDILRTAPFFTGRAKGGTDI